MSLVQDLLEKSKTNKEILSFIKWNDEETIWCGYAKDYNEYFVEIQHFTPYGRNDGTVIHPLNEFQRIEFNEDFSAAMQCIIDFADAINLPSSYNPKLGLDESFYSDVLRELAGNRSLIVCVQTDNEIYVTGYVLDVSEDDFAIQSIGPMGEDLGTSLQRVDTITGLTIDSLDCRKRDLLYRWRKASL